MNQGTEKTLLWYEILDNVFELAFEFDYGSFSLRFVSEEKAVQQIRKCCKPLSKDDAVESIKKCYELFDAIREVRRAFSEELKESDPYRTWYYSSSLNRPVLTIDESSLDKFTIELKKRCPEFGFLTCQKALVRYLRAFWWD